MIHYITGNLFDSHAQALVNTVNTQGVMGKGIALQFKEAYPNNYLLYRKACKAGLVKTGKMFITEETELSGNVRTIVNFPTKEQWRKPSQYGYISEGLNDLRKEILSRQISSIAIPPLGSSNGGLDWDRVRPMIEEALRDLACDITIYEPSNAIKDRMKHERVKLTPARAMLISVMSDMVAEDGTPSEFAAEKIAFFLQKFGAEKQFKLDFKPGYYGPYSGKVKYVLHYLNGSYIMGMGAMSNKPFDELWLTEDAAKSANAYLAKEENKEYMQIVNNTKAFLRGYYSNYMLELLATTAFLYDTDPAMLQNESENQQIAIIGKDLAKWSNRKEQLFHKEDVIKLALHHLNEIPKIK